MFFAAIVVLFLISLGLALLSLKKELNKTEHKKAKEIKESLAKGRVVFYYKKA